MKLGTENGTLISKYRGNFWDIDIKKMTVSYLDNKFISCSFAVFNPIITAFATLAMSKRSHFIYIHTVVLVNTGFQSCSISILNVKFHLWPNLHTP